MVGTLLATVLLLSACSSKKDAKKTAEKPAVLIPITNRVEVRRVWATTLGGESPKLRVGLDVAADGDKVFAANHKGAVEAFDLNTGRRLWRRQLKAPLSGGPSAGNGMVLVGSSKGEVIAVSEADGSVLWRAHVNAEILSGPSIGTDLVAVRGVDGKLHALSVKDGSENWAVDQQVPRLSLRGTSQPLLTGDFVVTGFDNGRVIAVNRRNGTTAWDAAVGQSHGSTELARLIDVDASVVGSGEEVFAVAYQGRVVRLARDTGQIIWTRDMSSYRGLAIDDANLYVSTAEGSVVCVDRKNGTEQWSQKTLVRRQLTAPVVFGGYVVVADAGGVLHWLDPKTGEFVARAQVNESGKAGRVTSKGIALKKRVSMQPIVAGALLLVFTDSGLLSAFRAGSDVSR
jgi:outer membrane protein assembly factor BamB